MLLVIGLDCAAPALVFDRLRPSLPAIGSLLARGVFGPLRSTMPPITLPAWACMFSGRDPGELGIYGFRDRVPGRRAMRVVTADDLRAPRVWDVLGDAGGSASVLYAPPSWPPRPIAGELLSCLLTPGPGAPHAHPPELEAELRERVGPHAPDVGHRAVSADELLALLHDAAGRHFDALEHLVRSRRRELAVMVEMGTDRLHHAMWPALDPGDPRHDPRSPLVRDARDYYAHLDARIARLLDLAGPAASVLVVSDHGARPLRGGFAINEWLRREGWLALARAPERPVPLGEAEIDGSRTRAWAEGGYHARVFLEPGPRREDELQRLEASLAAIRRPDGTPMRNRVVRPDLAFRAVNGNPPDLMVFFDDLDLRALGEVGLPELFVPPERAGRPGVADGCNHDWDGLFVLAGPEVPRGGRVEGASIHDVGVTALRLLGVGVPDGWLGRDLRSLA